jgi:hypothetical protein
VDDMGEEVGDESCARDLEEVLAAQSLRCSGPEGAASDVVCDAASGDKLCRIYNMGGGASVKATCCKHKRCSVWVTCREGRYYAIMMDIYIWASSARHQNKDDHNKLGLELKLAHHMKVRPAKASSCGAASASGSSTSHPGVASSSVSGSTASSQGAPGAASSSATGL